MNDCIVAGLLIVGLGILMAYVASILSAENQQRTRQQNEIDRKLLEIQKDLNETTETLLQIMEHLKDK